MYLLKLLVLSTIALAHPPVGTLVKRQATTTLNTGHIESTAASLLLPTFTTSTAQATSTGLAGVTGVDSNITTWANHWGWKGCSSGQKNAILNGLAEAHSVLGSDNVYYIDQHWNDYAVVEYLGSPWYAKQNNRRSQIKNVLRNAYSYQQHWYSTTYTQVFCMGDDVGYCASEASYIAVENEFDKNGLALAFCDRYFDLGSLQPIYDSASKGLNPYDLSEYENRARAWITALLRVKYVADFNPQKTRLPGLPGFRTMESASQVKWLAKGHSNDPKQRFKTVNNPSNFAWYAMAEWVQERLKNYPPRPQVPDAIQNAWIIAGMASMSSATDDSNSTCIIC